MPIYDRNKPSELWNDFMTYGSGFKLEAERDYDHKDQPLIFHLTMYGLVYPTDYELVGTNLNKLFKKAIVDGKKNFKEMLKHQNKVLANNEDV